MGAKVKPIITEGSENHIYLGIVDPRGPFPSRIYAHSMCLSDEPVLYVPRIFAYVIVVMKDDDKLIGHCYCSNCKDSINMFDTYCSHCGSRLRGRKILGEDYEEDSSVHVSS